MLSKLSLSLALAAAASVSLFASAGGAEARGGGKPHFVQDYQFKKPMHGYSGRAGEFYCDYVRLPDRKCVVAGGRERCKVVGWTLRQTCY
jgi:hypothetical protein